MSPSTLSSLNNYKRNLGEKELQKNEKTPSNTKSRKKYSFLNTFNNTNILKFTNVLFLLPF